MARSDDTNSTDDDDWCALRRAEVAAYLQREAILHEGIDHQPAWHIAPYASIWSVAALGRPGWRGWWVICGDLPTDYIAAHGLDGPRQAMRAFGERWLEAAAHMARGVPYPSMSIGSPADWPTLHPLLRFRAELLIEGSDDDANWTK